MPSQFKVQDEEWGEFKFFAIKDRGGELEKEFKKLENVFGDDLLEDLIPRIPYDDYLEIKHGYIQPFFDIGALKPEGCLIKASSELKICMHKDTCPSYDEESCSAELDPPACYEANYGEEVSENIEERTLVTRIFDLWKFGIYVIIVENEE